MVDLELLEAIRQMIREETAPIKEDVSGIKSDLAAVKDDVNGIKVILEVDIRRDINLLAEGHEMILERLPDPMEVEALDARLFAVETVVKKHSRDIQDLKKAQ